jgi:Na+-translocating ferredoxin:NAD+ oxidoreductase subunit C
MRRCGRTGTDNTMLKLLKQKSFAHGVHPPERKDETSGKAIRRLPFSPRMTIPLAQHIGKPALPIVRPGQEVVRGEPIARADGFMSVPMHAPATGVVEAIQLMPTARGPKTESIVLRVYEGDNQNVLYEAPRDVESLTREEIIAAVQETGMVGLGGAGFPTHAKLKVPAESRIDTLLVNGCECEPYLTTDHRLMMEWVDDLLRGIKLALKAIGTDRAIIGIEDNKPDAAEALRAHIAQASLNNVAIELVPTKYPQGAEKLLIKVLLDREVPSGGLPHQVGVVVQNIATLALLGRLVPKRQGLIERVITITGAASRPGNYLVPLGTPLRAVLDFAGFEGDATEVVLGGPMMGAAVASLDVPVTKPVSGVLLLDRKLMETPRKIQPCISCGRCLDACPLHLNPSRLGLLAAKREYATMAEHYHLNDCFECGCCTYVCPANIPLVQYFRIAKAMNREKAA